MPLIYGIMPAEILEMDESGLPIYDDRAVDDEYFARYHQELLYNGISAKISSSFQIMENTGFNLVSKAGAIFINGYFAYDVEAHAVTIAPASVEQNRIDRVVMRVDKTSRRISIEVLKGENGLVSMRPPDLVRNEDVYDMSLCTVSIRKGVSSIKQADITDTRMDKSVCGIVANYLGELDPTDLFAQYDDAFTAWFNRMKDQLSQDAAGNLQTQIDNKIIVVEKGQAIIRKPGSFYLVVTDTASGGGASDTIKVSPNMGLKII